MSSLLYSYYTQPDLDKPVLQFFEDGDWLRIECQGKPTKYMEKKLAEQLLRHIAAHARLEKTELYL